ncbi:MAG: NAD(P)/FAD-dependent oxidoreductase, partial [Actinobacteria bacterium]|nr:NAD(P)/FAD-dependent oxidoreductase [Actinomycetota bacterium]
LMLGEREPREISRKINRIRNKGVEFINAEIEEISPQGNSIKTNKQNISYDYLVVSLGVELSPQIVPGLSQAAYNLYDLDVAIRLRDDLVKFSSGNVVILVSGMPYKCPAAPYETALLLDYFFKTRGLRDKINISICTPEPLPMPTAGPQIGQAIKQMLEARNISFNPLIKITSVNSDEKELLFEGNKNVPFDLLVVIPPNLPPKVVKESDLAGEVGWIPVDRNTLKTKFDNIYAIGDVTAIKLPGQYKPDVPLMLPKAGVFAHNQAEVVANNLAVEINGAGSKKEFNGDGSCFLEIGYGKAGYAKGSFYNQPHPFVDMKNPSHWWHWSKILFEKYWLWKWFK